MKIIDIEVYELRRPFKSRFDIAGGGSTDLHSILVRIRTEEGVVGLGEAVPMPAYSGLTIAGVKEALIQYLIPALIGKSVHSIETLHQLMNRSIKYQPMAKAALDIAYHDAAGKRMGVPVYQLLGGAYRTEVPLAWAIGLGMPDEVVRQAKEAVDQGFGTIKVKIGLDPDRDLEVVSTLRSSLGPDIRIRVDANEGYDRHTARILLPKLQAYNLQLIEQPIPRWDTRSAYELTQRSTVPTLADESLQSVTDAFNLARNRAFDLFNIKLMKLGGLRPALKVASIAEAAGIQCMVGSMPELDIANMAGIHFAIAVPQVTYECELIGPLMVEGGIVADSVFRKTEGVMMASTTHKPGLGIQLMDDVDHALTHEGQGIH